MFPEVFVCSGCKREFVVRDSESTSVDCPGCGRYLGERRFTTVIESEVEDLIARLELERDRLEEDEAVYSQGEHSQELHVYGAEVHRALAIVRRAIADLQSLRASYR